MLISGTTLGKFHHDHPAPEKHDHVVLDMETGARVTFNDPRRFGAMDLVASAEAETHALLANLAVAAMLYAWREGDANMRSVWLCSRNDAIGNLAVMAAALGVFGTGSGWPDLAVAAVMGGLALTAARAVIQQARAELRPVSAHA